jgi:uncharacterized protein (DUF433 family)
MEWTHPDFPRIAISPNICFGKPRIKNSRFPISSILDYLASGMTIDAFLSEFDYLTREDVLQALAFSSLMMQDKFVQLQTVEA